MPIVSRPHLLRAAAVSVAAIASAFAATSASAQLLIELDNSDVTVPIGTDAVFTGIIVNDSADTVYLNYPQYEVTDDTDNALTGNDNYFYTYTPLSIGPGDASTDGIIFGMTLADDPAVIGLTFDGSFSILGGPDGVSNVSAGSTDNVGTVTFSVTAGAATAPEPDSLSLVAVGVTALCGLTAFRRGLPPRFRRGPRPHSI